MKLEECTTILDCFLWADEQWPGFWNTTTNFGLDPQNQSTELKQEAPDDTVDPLFMMFIEHFKKVARHDKTPLGKQLLFQGATCVKRTSGSKQ